jgi:hypothetical protein
MDCLRLNRLPNPHTAHSPVRQPLDLQALLSGANSMFPFKDTFTLYGVCTSPWQVHMCYYFHTLHRVRRCRLSDSSLTGTTSWRSHSGGPSRVVAHALQTHAR